MFCFILHSNTENGIDTNKIDIIFKGDKYSCLRQLVLEHCPKIKSMLQNPFTNSVEIDYDTKTEMNYFEDLWHIFNLRQIFVNINNIDFLEEISEYLGFDKLHNFCGKFRQQYSAILDNPIFLKLEELEDVIFSFKKIENPTINIIKTEKSEFKENLHLQVKDNFNTDVNTTEITESSSTSQIFQFNSTDIITTDSSFVNNNSNASLKIQKSEKFEEEEEKNEIENSDFNRFMKINFDHSYDTNIGSLIYEACTEKPHMCFTYMNFIHFLSQKNYDVTNIVSQIFKNSIDNTNRIDIFILRYLYEMNLLQYSQIPLRVKCSYYFSDKNNEGHKYSYDLEVLDYFNQIEKQEKDKMKEKEEEEKEINQNSVINFLFKNCGDWFRPLFENKMREGTNQTEAAISIRNDDIDKLRKIYEIQSLSEIDFANSFVKSDIFECSIQFPHKITYIDYSALYGATKCFKFLLLIGGKVNETTFSHAIRSANYEIIHIVYNFLTDRSKFSKETISNALNKALNQTIRCHSTELLDWLYNQNFAFFSLKNTCCTCSLFKDRLIDQQFFQCKKCISDGKCTKHEGFCYFCAKNCHRNHSDHLTLNMIRCSCDCGSEKCKGRNISHLISFEYENDNENNKNEDNENENNKENKNGGGDNSSFRKEIAVVDELVLNAVCNNSYRCLRFLIEQGVDLKKLNYGILTITAKSNDLKLFEVLLNVKRIKISKDKDTNMKTPLNYANINNNEALAKLIHDAYFSVNDLLS